ncbi:endonuclease/exonuclease/phosphatase family protein [Erythrobacter sp. R86502]|uniref:endonuclease/exonuclease/phosphatase family protein n=1 Tax=Erythrobacter sp. R86502 TaxID=3093846 RepID=UPI0036D29522
MHRQSKIRLGLTIMTITIAVLALIVSALSVTDSNEWWIRIWDFPRIQILVVILVTAAAISVLNWRRYWWLAAVLLIAAAWQFYRIMPYTILHPTEVAMTAKAQGDPACFSFVSLNVLQTNRQYDRTLKLLRETNPDVLLLLETDAAWQTALEPILSQYPSRLDRPLDNTYGLLFATRLPMASGKIEDIAEPDTPSMTAQLSVNRPFTLMGLHPRPPHPGQDTEERDAEILIAARRAARLGTPVVAIGDFNDVAWSNTSQTFKRIGKYLDPRIGRGTYATFPSKMPWLAWPLDHIFMTEDFTLGEIRVLEDVGSDHRPVYGRVCLTPRQGELRNKEPAAVTRDDRETAAEVMDEYREDQVEEARGED